MRQTLSNRVVIGALDSAMNDVDAKIAKWSKPGEGRDFLESLRQGIDGLPINALPGWAR